MFRGLGDPRTEKGGVTFIKPICIPKLRDKSSFSSFSSDGCLCWRSTGWRCPWSAPYITPGTCSRGRRKPKSTCRPSGPAGFAGRPSTTRRTWTDTSTTATRNTSIMWVLKKRCFLLFISFFFFFFFYLLFRLLFLHLYTLLLLQSSFSFYSYHD